MTTKHANIFCVYSLIYWMNKKKKKMIGVPDKMKNFLKIVLISQAFENVIVHFMMNV